MDTTTKVTATNDLGLIATAFLTGNRRSDIYPRAPTYGRQEKVGIILTDLRAETPSNVRSAKRLRSWVTGLSFLDLRSFDPLYQLLSLDDDLSMQFQPGEINIICTDIRRSLDFYVGILGFEFVEQERGAHRLKSGGLHYLLLPFASTSAPPHAYCEQAAISFDLLTSEPIAAVATQLAELGVVFEKSFQEGQISFVIRDPDNLCIEIIESKNGRGTDCR